MSDAQEWAARIDQVVTFQNGHRQVTGRLAGVIETEHGLGLQLFGFPDYFDVSS